jgi:hypothetical protein
MNGILLQELLSFDTTRTYTKNDTFNVFTEPLPSSDKGIHELADSPILTL